MEAPLRLRYQPASYPDIVGAAAKVEKLCAWPHREQARREKNMLICDAQVHIWGANTPQRPWPEHGPPQRHPLGNDELLMEMDKAGVDRVVIVPPSWEGDRNDLANEAALEHPARFASMGRFDPEAPGARQTIRTWKQQPGMLGMRFTFHTPLLQKPLLDGGFDRVWGEAERLGIPIFVLFHHEHMHLLGKVTERYPDLELVVDHLGLKSTVKDEARFAGIDKLLVLAKRPNIAVKSTALPCYSTEAHPFRRLHPFVKRVLESFGPRRMFRGTDWSRLPCTWKQAITLFTEEFPWLKGEDLDWVMGRGVCDWIGWKV